CGACRGSVQSKQSHEQASDEILNHSDKIATDGSQSTVCGNCGGTGFHGRMLLAEWLTLDDRQLAEAVLKKADARELARWTAQAGSVSLREVAASAVASGLTTQAEVFRVLGRPDATRI
ncbi:MAG: hypothetical protein KDA85_07830, partial [Planctomycetaceae bacterium]|nr:hypothetical protein [Planctomycetaceae bacterium]